MSSPPDSLTDIEESALNKKRGRAQSVEPTPLQEIEDENPNQETSATTVSAPKKTKRDDEDNTTTVSTIRKNMKDMSTTDKNLTESQSTATSESQEDDEQMGTIEEEEDDEKTNSANSLAAKFGGGGKDDDDWGEFAEEEDEVKPVTKETKEESDKPKYTFGASSGFGTKGWAASHQTIPTPSKQPTFGGFGSSSGFGGFSYTTSSLASTPNNNNTTSATSSVPSFGSFAKATTSPFAAAAAAAAGNALSSPHQVTSPTTSSASTDADNNKEPELNESDNESNNNDTPAFGEGAKVKVPGVKQQTEVKTGEEDEDTIYQTKAKLLVLDSVTGSWKERGVGTFRINMKEEETKQMLQTRLVMRTDSVYRLILNLLLFKEMKVKIMQDKFVQFAGFETETKEDGTLETKPITYALKLSNPTVASEVYEQIISCIPKA